jgi:hypothetical protein
MTSRNVSAATVKKVRNGGALTVGEMTSVLKAGVPEAPLLSYVKQTGGVSSINATQISQLKAAGASDAFIDYLLKTQKLYYQQMDSIANPPYNPANDYYYQPLPRPPRPNPKR